MADPKTFADAIRIALREEALEVTSVERVNVVEGREDQMGDLIGMLGKLLSKNEASQSNFSNFRGNNVRFP